MSDFVKVPNQTYEVNEDHHPCPKCGWVYNAQHWDAKLMAERRARDICHGVSNAMPITADNDLAMPPASPDSLCDDLIAERKRFSELIADMEAVQEWWNNRKRRNDDS